MVAYPKNSSKRIGSGTQVGDFPQVFQGVAFFLQRIGGWIGSTQYFNFLGVDLSLLALTRGFNQ
ncbi:MAG: hypothetical protein BWY72_00428 [Bacteroidetes bacterium ADurb.Bin416]|nr:MAG: hypothetical protein BWY72_00428 [Bacteroidetes bacterium ADurb.Bin416]